MKGVSSACRLSSNLEKIFHVQLNLPLHIHSKGKQPTRKMTLKLKVGKIVDIALRVPPILFLDVVLKHSSKVKSATNNKTIITEGYDGNGTVESFLEITGVLENVGFSLISFLLYIQVFIITLFVFFFSTKQLLLIYIRIASIIIIIFAYDLNINYVNTILSRCKYQGYFHIVKGEISTHLRLFMLALVFSFTNPTNLIPHAVIWTLFFLPLLACIISAPLLIIKITPIFSTLVCTTLLVYSMWLHGLSACEKIYKSITWCHNVVENYGLYNIIETHWINLQIAQVFRTFWIIRVLECVFEIVCMKGIQTLTVNEVVKACIIYGSENVILIFGMTSIVSFLCQKIGYNIQVFLQVDDPNEKNIGNISATLFLLLSIQSGIVGLAPDTRYYYINRNLCLILISQLYFTHDIVNKNLLSLSISKHPSIKKHIRNLTASLLLLLSLIYIQVYLWKREESSTWLFATTSFIIELIIKTLVSITIYVLFIIDCYKNGLWENLDDYIYFLKVTASFTEFILGIGLLINGMCIFIVESPSMIRICMICLHAYFNVWSQGLKGLEIYLLRCTSIKKINSLCKATASQLKFKKDVCAICFQEMKTASITKCNHFFHSICLRKWLNIQETCPLCHTKLYEKNLHNKNS